MARHDSPKLLRSTAGAALKPLQSRRHSYRLATARLKRLRQRKESRRVAFIDHARGIALLLVVLLQATTASGAIPGSVAAGLAGFAAPFALPAFLFMAGLFAPRSVALPWSKFATRRIAPYAVTGVAWVLVLMIASAVAAAHLPGASFIEVVRALAAPFATLQLLWLVPLCLIIFKLVGNLRPALVAGVALAAALLQGYVGPPALAAVMGGFFYFYAGAFAAPRLLEFARVYAPQPHLIVTALILWGGLEAFLVFDPAVFQGTAVAQLPLVNVGLGLAGTAAVVAVARLTAGLQALDLLRFVGCYWVAAYLVLLPCFAIVGPPFLSVLALFGRTPRPIAVGAGVTLSILVVASLVEQFWLARRRESPNGAKTREA